MKLINFFLVKILLCKKILCWIRSRNRNRNRTCQKSEPEPNSYGSAILKLRFFTSIPFSFNYFLCRHETTVVTNQTVGQMGIGRYKGTNPKKKKS
jgi:hypothetical protein